MAKRMVRKVLKNKPLIEGIFELRWELKEVKTNLRTDPHYKIFVGRIYDRVRSEYPFHEQLPTATMPDEIAGYIVQHRFRKGEGKWPLIQIGPGIITLNDTEGYVWEDFEKRITNVLDVLFEAYPDAETNLNVNRLLLRYIDAIKFDYGKDDIFRFLKEKMKMNVEIYERLYQDTGVVKIPSGLDLRFSFPSTKPRGAVYMRFARGRRDSADALIWETMVEATENHAPKDKRGILDWVNSSHSLVSDWFFKIIEGDLQKRFE